MASFVYPINGSGAVGHEHPDEALANSIATADRLHRQGELGKALTIYQRAISTFPDEPEPQFRAALVLAQQDRLVEAEAALRAALLLAERSPYLFALGDTLERMGRNREAIDIWQRAVVLDPRLSRAYARLGVALMTVGSTHDAFLALETATTLNPHDARSWWNLALAAEALGRDDRAIGALQRYSGLRPENVQGWNRLGYAFLKPGFVVGAHDAFLRVTRYAPEQIDGWLGLAKSLTHLGDYRQAISALSHAEALASSDADRIASQRLVVMHYDPGCSAQEIFTAHLDWARHYAPTRPAPSWSNRRDPDRKLKIGYLSPRFHEASVASLYVPVLESHDPGSVDVYCYAEQAIDDAVTHRIRRCCRSWRNTVGFTDEVLAKLIRDDEIDILIDLAGHTPGNRLRVLAYRSAPLQGTWLDYFNTTGIDGVDFLLSDAEHSPHDDMQPFVERLVRLPALRYCWEPPAMAPPVCPPTATPAKSVAFGAFCRLAKLSQETLSAWCQILESVPGAILILKSTALAGTSERQHVARRFAERGIDPSRIDLRGPSSYVEMLAQYNDIDIVLDTFPYNGGLTTLEALWMGRPVIALNGTSLIGRQSRAILAAVGLRELVANSLSDYVRLASTLARDPDRLAKISNGMRNRLKASPALDVNGFVRALEATYRAEWRQWCQLAGAKA